MDQELQDKLYEKYPQFFSNKDKGIQSSCMAWGCECGNGWHDLISCLCWMIRQHEDNKKWRKKYLEENDPEKLKQEPEYFPIKFDQIKEKYGGLRAYFSGGDDYVEGLVSMAEAMSYKICEVCGERGSPNKGGWISTLCNSCRSKNEQGL
jgi:hypothetical protein